VHDHGAFAVRQFVARCGEEEVCGVYHLDQLDREGGAFEAFGFQ
jgi:hypothetical protein